MMPHANAPTESSARRVVTAETLTPSPAIIGQPLAEPWRRLAAIAIDLVLVSACSFLARPWLGVGTGTLLLVLFGTSQTVSLPLKIARWFCRGVGGLLVLGSALQLGHVP